jgi:hypothetical protein
MSGLRVFVCSNTHWDREWHTPFRVFQARLVQLFDLLLPLLRRDAAYRVFNMDGQTIVLEDILDMRPDLDEELRALIAAGRITIGPWYVMPDEFLPSGEALIRNLLMGSHLAQQYGPCSRVGYLPDMFGHIAQMPQLLRGFGIDTAIVWRGISSATLPSEFVWTAPDGSRTLTHRINERVGYGIGWFGQWPIHSALGVKLDPAVFGDPCVKAEWFVKIVELIAARATTNVIYYPHGTDHTLPDADTSTWLSLARTLRPQWEIVHATLDEYVAALRAATASVALQEVHGELRMVNRVPYRRGRPVPVNYVLNGVLSTRMDVKLEHHACERLLTYVVDPLAACASALDAVPAHALLHVSRRRAWREVLRNQAHDSIACCSTDEVMDDVMTRYRHARAFAGVALREALECVFAHLRFTPTLRSKTLHYALVRTSPAAGAGAAQVAVHLPVRGPRPLAFALADADGRPVPAVLESVTPSPDALIQLGWYDDPVHVAQVSLDPGPCHGYTVTALRLLPGKKMPRRRWRTVPGVRLANRALAVIIHKNGRIDLNDIKRGRLYRDIISFDDGGDAGDTYSYAPPRRDRVLRLRGECEAITYGGATPVVQRARLQLRLRVPAGLNAHGTARSVETVDLPISLELALWDTQPYLELSVSVVNTARDHRLRLLVHTGAATTDVWSEGHFDIQCRPYAVASPPREAWIETGPTEFNNKSFVATFDGTRGLAVAPHGLQAHELLPDARGAIALTLLRCVGALSRGDLTTRATNAGPSIPTPQAQMQGPQRYRLAIMPCTCAADLPAIQELAEASAAQTLAYAGVFAKPAAPLSLLHIEGSAPASVKPAEDGDGIIVRLWNGTSQPRRARVCVPWATIQTALLVRLDETVEPAGPALSVSTHAVALDVPAKAICSLRLRLS